MTPVGPLRSIQASIQPVPGMNGDFTGLLDHIGDASYVLIGEASHGTHEFYRIRAEITKELIRNRGFHAVAVEADWPDAHRVDRFVRARSADQDADTALSDFQRFPRWMWRNRDVREFVQWLREHNQSRKSGAEVGFYGLDLYSLNRSRTEVIRYLDRIDPSAAKRARERYSCFDHFGADPQAYGLAAGSYAAESCEDEVTHQLIDLQRRAYDYMHRDGLVAEDDFFSAEQNARLVRNAEEYYRAMFRGRVSSWNLRDSHMAETLDGLASWLKRRFGGQSKIVVWAHNSHLGDARATEMGRRGEHNLGQLVRQSHPGQSFLLGFTTWGGTVTAADDWDGEAETKVVRPGMADSWEGLFHEVGRPAFLLSFRTDRELSIALAHERLQRAIGVIYRPRTERVSHYFNARLAEQFDAVIHIDSTRAVEPLDPVAQISTEEAPETFPSGV